MRGGWCRHCGSVWAGSQRPWSEARDRLHTLCACALQMCVGRQPARARAAVWSSTMDPVVAQKCSLAIHILYNACGPEGTAVAPRGAV